MPKKPPARHSSAQSRPQPKRKEVLLVRSTSSTEVVEADEEEETEELETTEETTKAAATKTKPASGAVKTTARPAATPVKRPATATKPGVQPSRALALKRGGRPGQRGPVRAGPRIKVGRQANLVSAEHYRYVLKDLRLIAILAFFMFAILIALTFILPHLLKY